MRIPLLVASLLSIPYLAIHTATAQDDPADPVSDPPGVRLQLTMEVATTTRDGLPAALRFTLENVGSVAVDIPEPAIYCSGFGGDIHIDTAIHFDGKTGSLGGFGCGGGSSGGLPFLEQIRQLWFHLRPGEFLIFTGDRRRMIYKSNAPGTYEYHAVYVPPRLTSEQRRIAAQNGYIIPVESVESDSMRYHEK